jgi:hypothetical protein
MIAGSDFSGFFVDLALREEELMHIRDTKISLHHAKATYSYPTIRLPRTFSKLAGLPIRIFQTEHNGALAFLVVVSPSDGRAERPKKSENLSASSRYSPLHGEGRRFESDESIKEPIGITLN